MKTLEPIERRLGAGDLFDTERLLRPGHDDDRQAQSPRGPDLRIGCSTAGILRHHHVDALALHKRALGSLVERRTILNGNDVRHRQRIAVVVTKNSGGAATYPKIAAARSLGLTVIVVIRPETPLGVEEVASAEAALDWLERLHGRSP